MERNKEQNFILIHADILPEVFSKVLEVKELLEKRECRTASEAAAKVGISRSAFYKYKDHVFSINGMHGIITLSLMLLDIRGVLSEILNWLAAAEANILTINQNIPVNGVANITISMQTDQMNCSVQEAVRELAKLDGVQSIEVLARE